MQRRRPALRCKYGVTGSLGDRRRGGMSPRASSSASAAPCARTSPATTCARCCAGRILRSGSSHPPHGCALIPFPRAQLPGARDVPRRPRRGAPRYERDSSASGIEPAVLESPGRPGARARAAAAGSARRWRCARRRAVRRSLPRLTARRARRERVRAELARRTERRKRGEILAPHDPASISRAVALARRAPTRGPNGTRRQALRRHRRAA